MKTKKPITELIEFLKDVKKSGGNIEQVEFSNGIRDLERHDEGYEEAQKCGFCGKISDGTFSIKAFGNYGNAVRK